MSVFVFCYLLYQVEWFLDDEVLDWKDEFSYQFTLILFYLFWVGAVVAFIIKVPHVDFIDRELKVWEDLFVPKLTECFPYGRVLPTSQK